MLRSFVHVVFAAALLALVPAGDGQAQQKTSVVFSAGPTGGSWTPMAAATIPTKRASAIQKRTPRGRREPVPQSSMVGIASSSAERHCGAGARGSVGTVRSR